MSNADARVTIHMAASLDGYIARRDGSVDWLETTDHFEGGEVMPSDPMSIILDTIDCYVMGARTYETALAFMTRGFGWPYGDTPTFVLTHRQLPRSRDSIEFAAGDLQRLVNERLRPRFKNIWFVGGGALSGECLRRGLADELRYAVLPILIGDGISFFDRLDKDVPLHLLQSKAYRNGMLELRYEVKRSPGD